MSYQGQVDPEALSALNAADREERDLRRAEREAGSTIGAVGGAVGGLRRLGESMPRVLYEWHFAAGSGWKGRIVETEPGIIKAQQAKCGETEYYWDDVPGGPMGWANEIIHLAKALEQQREATKEAWRAAALRAWYDCLDCGTHVKVDEDGCCATCGRDAKFVDTGAIEARLREYQRALLWCYGWMMNGMTAEFAKAIDDDEKYRKVKSLVGEASEEVEP